MRPPAPDSVQVYVRFHKELCAAIEELAAQTGRKRATTAAWILTREVEKLLRKCPDYRASADDIGIDGTEDVYYLSRGRQPERVSGPAMILTVDRRTERDLELFAENLTMPVSNFRTALLAVYLRSLSLI